jgi:hypothetical protein
MGQRTAHITQGIDFLMLVDSCSDDTRSYVYFEKVRIAEGKKKTATRLSNEATRPGGFPLENRRKGWFPT